MGTLRRPRGSLPQRQVPAPWGLPAVGASSFPPWENQACLELCMQPEENTGAVLVEGGGRTWVQISAALICLLSPQAVTWPFSDLSSVKRRSSPLAQGVWECRGNGCKARGTGLGRGVAQGDEWVDEWVDDPPAEDGGWSQVDRRWAAIGGTRVSDGTAQGHAASGHRTPRGLQCRDCKLGPSKWVEGGNESQPPLPLTTSRPQATPGWGTADL